MSQSIKVDIWSDIACPWCYLGKHRFAAAVREFAQRNGAPRVEVQYHSFQLNPGMPTDYPGSHDEYLSRHLGWTADRVAESNRQMQSLGAELGLVYDFARNRMANSHKAHELLHYAKARGRYEDVLERLFRAYFSEGRHIGKIDELAAIAAEAGLDRDDVGRSLNSGEYAAAVDRDITVARSYGIGGVPFYVLDGKYGVSGAQEPKVFLGALEKVASEKVAS